MIREQTTNEEVAAKANAIQQQALAIEADRDLKQQKLVEKDAELEALKAQLAEAEAGKKKAEEETNELLLAKEIKEKDKKRNL